MLPVAWALSRPLDGLDESISSASSGVPMLPFSASRSMLMPVTLVSRSASASSSEPLSERSHTSDCRLRTLSMRMSPCVSIRYTAPSARAFTVPAAVYELSMSNQLSPSPIAPAFEMRLTLFASISAAASL